MSAEEKQELMKTIASLPEANKNYVYGYAVGVMDAIKTRTAAEAAEATEENAEPKA